MGFRDRINSVVAELQEASGNPEPRSVDQQTDTVRTREVDKHVPEEKKLDRYWDLYQKVPIIRQPIRSFASEVVGPGYYIDAEDEDMKEDLEKWLAHSAIVGGEIDKDFRNLLKKATIQREVKGTSIIEKVEDEDGNLYGFKLIRPETVRAFTNPGQTVLLDPDLEIEETNDFWSRQDIYETDDGQLAAYVQLDQQIRGLDDGNNHYIPFTRDQILKLTRDADVGDVFGEGRITAVEDRLESLLKKLEDNDKAIESLAHPLQLFQFGSEDSPWQPEKMRAFMSQHEQGNFEPGMKQGVQGDVSVETVSGEVAPIESFLDFDINWIISEMPLPKYALGGFEENVNQFVSRSQETRVENQIEEAREEIQSEWNPVLEDKAEELGYDPDDFNSLVIGQDPEEMNLADMVEQEKKAQENNQGAGGTDFTRPPASTEESRQQNEEGNNNENSGDGQSDSSQETEEEEMIYAELSRIEEISSSDSPEQLADVTLNSLEYVRDTLIEEMKAEFNGSTKASASSVGDNIDRVVDSSIEHMFRNAGTEESEELFDGLLSDTIEELSDYEVIKPSESDELLESYHEAYANSVRKVANEIGEEIANLSRRSISKGEEVELVERRIRDVFSDQKLENRSRQIAYMESFGAKQAIELSAFEGDDDVIGITFMNTGDNLTPVCSELTGKQGEKAIALFEREEDISEQLSNFVSEENLHEGFNPIPNSPPFHHWCGTEIVPIFEGELDMYEDSLEVIR